MNYKYLHFESLDSTNKYVKDHYDELPDLVFVSAEHQDKGRGRYDRSWVDTKGENLLFSVLIKNEEVLSLGGYLSVVIASSVSSVLESIGLLHVSIKWPNDIYVNGKKICGILLEGQLPNYLVVGVGVNINESNFDGEYRHEPTSAAIELGRRINVNSIKHLIFNDIFVKLSKISQYKEQSLYYFKSHNYLLGKKVEFKVDEKSIKGIVNDVDNNFNIIIETENGEAKICSGEITEIK